MGEALLHETPRDAASPWSDGLPEEIAALGTLLDRHEEPHPPVRLTEALRRWPEAAPLHLLRLRWLERRGDAPDALAGALSEAEAHCGTHPWVAVRLFRHRLAAGERAAAWAIFAETIWQEEALEASAPALLNQLVAATPDAAERRQRLESLLHGGGQARDRFLLVKLAALAFRADDRMAAARLYAEAEALGPLPPGSIPLQLDLLLAAGRHAEALARAQALLAEQPDRPELVRKAALAAHFAGDRAGLARLHRQAIARWPTDWMTLWRYNRCGVTLAEDRALFDDLRARVTEEEACRDPRWAFQFAVACLRHGATSRALALLRDTALAPATAHMAEPLCAALGSRPLAAWSNPRGISDDVTLDLQLVEAPGAVATVVVLGGVQGGLGYLPYSHADALFRPHPVNLAYLRDPRNRGFRHGIPSLAADEAGTVAALGRLLRERWGGLPVVTLGASLGGLAALRYGALLGAARAISFAGPVHLDRRPDAPPDGRAGLRAVVYAGFVAEAEAATGGGTADVLSLLRDATGTRFIQCFGAENAQDRQAAELLRGLPHVELRPIAGCADHFVAFRMIADGQFDALLAAAVSGPG